MYRFVALIWNPEDTASTACAAQWSDRVAGAGSTFYTTLAVDGMKVFSAAPKGRALQPYLLPREMGIVLGRLFSRREPHAMGSGELTIDDKSASSILESAGRHLIENYWGSYVAFLRSADGRNYYVIRDCSGWTPCYRTKRGSIEIFFSDMGALSDLRLPPFPLNPRYLASFIYSPQLQIHECGFQGVTEILAGECVEVSQCGTRQFSLWNPARIAERDPIEDYSQAERRLKQVTEECISAWSGVYDSILLSLSGGLDSSIVLGCLRAAPTQPKVICLNQCMENSADDERRYARLAASRAQVALVEQPWSAPTFNPSLFELPKAPKPGAGDMYWWLELSFRNELAQRTNAEAIWTGQGGDHLFWAFKSYPVAADYASRNGLRPGLLRVIDESARLSKRSYFSVIRNALGHRSSSVRSFSDVPDMTNAHFVNADLLREISSAYMTNPWVSSGETLQLPPSKQGQILELSEVLNRHRHLPGAEHAYQHHPLLSQPLIELCLQIPMYVFVRGGRRRALARSAFADRIPREIIAREDKGNTTARVMSMIRENEKFLRDILLDGILVGDHIVDRAQLQAILVEGQPYRPGNSWPLLACISAEIWARTWSTGTSRVAA